MGQDLKKEINVLYKCLEIEIDGVFKSLLLLKKKKYAALVVNNWADPSKSKIEKELKGLDMVRRDWCNLSKSVGNFVLDQIMSGRQKEDIILTLNDYLSDIGEKLKKSEINLSEFIITKQLTKGPSEYSDYKALPHVRVALDLMNKGKSETELINNFIPYVIC